MPDDKWGEWFHAVVRLKDGAEATASVIFEHCQPVIAAYECSRSIDFIAEPMPLSGAGK